MKYIPRSAGKASLSFDRKNIRGICDYLAMNRQKIGVVVSLAPQAVFSLPGDRRVINLPIYLLEQLPAFAAVRHASCARTAPVPA